MYALSYVADPKQQKSILDYSLTDKLNSPDLKYIMSGQSYTPTRKAFFRHWLYTSFSAVKAKLPPFNVAELPYYTGSGCEIETLEATNLSL